MDDRRSDETGRRSTAGETARTLAAQTMLNLVRLTRLGFQAAAAGFGRLEENISRRQQKETGETRPVGEAPPTAHTTQGERGPGPGATEMPGERTHRPGPSGRDDPEQSRH